MKNLKFSLTIDSVFNIMTKGILVTGMVETGVLNIDDELELIGDNSVKKAKCSSIERYLKPVKTAQQGEYIGIVLTDVTPSDIKREMKLIIKE